MSGPWLFGPRADLAVFGGPFLASLALLGVGAATGLLHADLPIWGWLLCVVCVDVAHVWSTLWRLGTDALGGTRTTTFIGITLLAWIAGVVLHAVSSLVFWRVLAYAAVFHFVRQQIGWVALYRRREGRTSVVDHRFDEAMIYASTLYPVVYWHTHLPRPFSWFLDGDFLALPAWLAVPAAAAHAVISLAWCGREALGVVRGGAPSWGRWLVVASTWCCWYVGIVVLDSDFAFTVTNVLIHGVPYVALVWWYGREASVAQPRWARLFASAWPTFFLVPLVLAFGEELLWDRFVWDDHAVIFGSWGDVLEGPAATLLVPLLALPQAAHYALDGVLWRTREDPVLRRLVEGSREARAKAA